MLQACGVLARALKTSPRWAPFTFGCLYLWKVQPFPTSSSHPRSPASRQRKAGSQDASITAHQGDDIIAHWQGYLRRDREVFFGGLTEIDRSFLGSILLPENSRGLEDNSSTRVLCFWPPLTRLLPRIWLTVISLHQPQTLLFHLLCTSCLFH